MAARWITGRWRRFGAWQRPGTLTNDPGTGRVRIGMAIPYGEVSRDDLAAVLVELIHMPRIRRTILELTGGETPITEALERAVCYGLFSDSL